MTEFAVARARPWWRHLSCYVLHLSSEKTGANQFILKPKATLEDSWTDLYSLLCTMCHGQQWPSVLSEREQGNENKYLLKTGTEFWKSASYYQVQEVSFLSTQQWAVAFLLFQFPFTGVLPAAPSTWSCCQHPGACPHLLLLRYRWNTAAIREQDVDGGRGKT